MYLKITLLPLLMFFIHTALFSQTVTTLVNDSSRAFEAIHWHPDGRIFSVDYANGRVYRVHLDGTVETLVTGLSYLAGGGFGADGTFYFSGLGGGKLYRLNPDGTYTTIASGLKQPTGILQSSSVDTLYVGEYEDNAVVKVSISSGTKTSFVSANGIDGPDGVIDDGNGNILIANYDDNKIHLADLAGNVSLFATLPSSGTMGYLTRFGENIYVPSIAGRKVYKVAMDGSAVVFAGSGAAGNADGAAADATFSNPNGIVINPTGDTLLVADGSRIRMITNLEGTTKSVELEQLIDFKISPNPASKMVTLVFDAVEVLQLEWQIYNSQGQVVLQNTSQKYAVGENEIRVSIEDWSVGVYSFQLMDGEGRRKVMQFVKSE